MRRAVAIPLALALATTVVTTGATAQATRTGPAPAKPTAAVDVMFVGNNWDGTATVVDAETYRPIRTIDTIPDRTQRMAEITTSPAKLAFFLAIQAAIGEGNAQYTDDMFTTHDGRLLAVSRPSFADVVGIDLASGASRWRFPMEGYRSDHMGVSPTASGCWSATRRRTRCTSSTSARDARPASSPAATARTRTTTPPTASGSSTPASAASTPRSTGPSSASPKTPPRVRSTSRSCAPTA